MAGPLTPARAAGLAGLAAAAGGALTLNRTVVGVFYDDGIYAGLAWALAHGRGYVYPNLPGTPAAIHYPPLYPLLLAPLFRAFSIPAAVLAAKVLNVLCAALAAALVAWHAVRRALVGDGVSPWVVVAVVAAAATAIPWLTVLTTLMSEPLFALLTVCAVALADEAPGRLGARGGAAAAGTAAAAALLVRSIGVAVCVGVVAQVWRSARGVRGRSAVGDAAWAAAPCLAAAAGWAGWVWAHRGGLDPLLAIDYGSYGSLVSAGNLQGAGRGVVDLVRPVAVLTMNWVRTPLLYYVCGAPALAVGVCGLARLAKRSAIGMALLVYLAVLVLWPVPPDRFLWAVLPWLALAWAAGAAALWPIARARVPVAVLAAALGFGVVRYEVRGLVGRWWEQAGATVGAQFVPILQSVDSLPPDAVIASDYEPLVSLYTGHRAVPFYIYALDGRSVLQPPASVHRQYLERQGVSYIVAGSPAPGGPELARLEASFPTWLEVVRRWPGGRVLYAIRHAS